MVEQYFELLTNRPLDQLPENARERQKLLALDIVSQYHGEDAAQKAQIDAGNLVGGKTTQADTVPEFSLAAIQFPAKFFYIVSASGLCKSSSEARKQIQGGGVRLDGEQVTDVNLTFDSPTDLNGRVLQLGKNKFVRLVNS